MSCSRLILWLLETCGGTKNKRNTIWRVENRETLKKKKKKTKNLQLSLRESANPSYKEIRFFDGFR